MIHFVITHPFLFGFIVICIIVALLGRAITKAPYENTGDDLPNIHDTHFD